MTFQFTTEEGKVVSLAKLAEDIAIPTTFIIENIEGIYYHGKINAVSYDQAIEILENC